jgi:hypothetical protein
LFTNRQNSLCMWPANAGRTTHKILISQLGRGLHRLPLSTCLEVGRVVPNPP